LDFDWYSDFIRHLNRYSNLFYNFFNYLSYLHLLLNRLRGWSINLLIVNKIKIPEFLVLLLIAPEFLVLLLIALITLALGHFVLQFTFIKYSLFLFKGCLFLLPG